MTVGSSHIALLHDGRSGKCTALARVGAGCWIQKDQARTFPGLWCDDNRAYYNHQPMCKIISMGQQVTIDTCAYRYDLRGGFARADLPNSVNLKRFLCRSRRRHSWW